MKLKLDIRPDLVAMMKAEIAAGERAGSVLVLDETTADLDIDRGRLAPGFDGAEPGTVVRIGSLGKTMWGGLRLGWVRADGDLIRRLVAARPTHDLGTPEFEQALATRLLTRFDDVVAQRSHLLREGRDAVLVAYGPVLLHEALLASELLAESGALGVRVVALPWLNRFDAEWLAAEVASFDQIFVLEDHSPVGGLGDGLRRALDGRALSVLGVEGWPACGTPEEALRFHGLDGASLADRIAARVGVRSVR